MENQFFSLWIVWQKTQKNYSQNHSEELRGQWFMHIYNLQQNIILSFDLMQCKKSLAFWLSLYE